MSKTVVLISGANQGLGLEISKKLAHEQSDFIILIGSRDLQKGEDAAKSITHLASGTSVHAIQLDITSDDSISACVSEIEKRFDARLDVLINNAGIASREANPRKRYQLTLETNVTSAACLTEACIPLLKKAAVPRVVFMSSGLGSITNTLIPSWPFYGLEAHAYQASKAAMNMVAAGFAVKYEKDGFKVNACDPGYRKTSLNNFADAAGDASEGAVNACRLATLSKDGETGTFSDIEGPISW